MKRHGLLVAPAICLACALTLAGCAREPKALSEEGAYQRFVGTWVNAEYPGTLHRSPVSVIRPDCVAEDRLLPDSTGAAGEWKIDVKKAWVDEKGNTYCQFSMNFVKGSDFAGTALMRVDKRRKVLEINSRQNCQHVSAEDLVCLERIDPLMSNYWIYYRK